MTDFLVAEIDVLSEVANGESIAMRRSLVVDYVVALRSYQHSGVRSRRPTLRYQLRGQLDPSPLAWSHNVGPI